MRASRPEWSGRQSGRLPLAEIAPHGMMDPVNGVATRKELERQVRILNAIGVSSPDFVYVFDRDQRFIYVSPPLLRLWGKTLEEAVGKNFAELGYPADLVALHKSQLDDALRGKVVSGANLFRDARGEEGRYEYTFVPVFDEEGKVESIVGTTRDVTERWRAELERQAALDRLGESEAQFRHFADAMPQLAWIAKDDGFIYWYNRRWYEYTGTTPQQMEGWGWQSVHHPEELPTVMERWQVSIHTGEPFEMTFPLRGADKRFRYFLTRVNPVRNARGKITHWFGTNTDVDAQKQAMAERDAALAATEQAVRLRDDFLSIASHELRTPLAAMLLQLQGLERQMAREPGGDRMAERLRKAVRAGTRLDRLITELLEVSRIAGGQLRLESERIDLCRVVREVCARYESVPGRELHISCGESLVGSWDPLRLEQVVTNLVDNALKYGAGKPVFISARAEGATAVLEVRDQGIGVPEADQARIFDRFARSSSAREYGGFGLGLWIARQVVEASGGRISVQSREGEGSTFRVDLPLKGDGAWLATGRS